MRTKKPQSEFSKFDDAMRKILSIPHEELKSREAEWRRQKAAKKRQKKVKQGGGGE